MLRNVAILLILAITVYSLFDMWQATDVERREVSKFLWAIAIVLFPLIGAVFWFLVSYRARNQDNPPHGPDDDPDFLNGLS